MTKSETQPFRVGLVQLRSGRNVEANLATAERLIRDAARGGAIYIQTPENSAVMELEPERLFAAIQTEPESVALSRFRSLAAELGIWLHIGSLAVKLGPDRVANRSFLISAKGEIAARYDKLHLFDVDLAGGESYRESRLYQSGDKAVIADLPFGRLGLSICYDLRFPALYRALAMAGAGVIAVPSAFTKQTGEAHWSVLLRARAIETGAFVLAAAQGGAHENGRSTYGHSMVVSPWGEVLAEAGEDPGVIFAEINLNESAAARARIPSLQHGRGFEVEGTSEKRS
ncbi:MAG TPA: carbon-nitrogen hydrolase family protein [Methyloceanibacter sp.]|nr:carbon-nitrogen hydrolase family protein [Methyloceanibacter sp.]